MVDEKIKLSGAERRRSPRVERNVPIKISTPVADLVTETKNLSSAGIYCRVNTYIEPMTKLAVTLLLPFKRGMRRSTKKVTCAGVVVRTENIPNESEFYTAIFFNDIKSKDSKTLNEFISGVLTQDQG